MVNSTWNETILQVKGETETFWNKGRLKESVPSRLTHMERLKEYIQTEKRGWKKKIGSIRKKEKAMIRTEIWM